MNLSVRYLEANDLAWALPKIAEQILEGYIAGDVGGVEWCIKEEE